MSSSSWNRVARRKWRYRIGDQVMARSTPRFTRRAFVGLTIAAGAETLAGCGFSAKFAALRERACRAEFSVGIGVLPREDVGNGSRV